MKRAWLSVITGLSLCAPGFAQPRGPADVIGGARRARDAQDLQQAATRGTTEGKEEAKAEDSAAQDPQPSAGPIAPHGGVDEDGPDRTPIAVERADPSLPTGTIRVRVVDAAGAPVAGADVAIGIMSADSTRSSRDEKTGGDGSVLVRGLASGDKQAYRVNVPYQGAKYSSTPFRLPPNGGYDVAIRRLPVTRDERLIVLYLGATSLELKDERVKIVQEAQLLNIGSQTYVFPEAGVLVPLPKGFLAVQSQESMTDQHIAEAAGEGLRVTGSLPPGQATLLWGFDLPLTSTDLNVVLDIPWTTFSYRVIADAPAGMSLAVEGMPDPILHEDGGRRFLVTETQRKVGDSPFKRLNISLHGIPGPGPLRWIAAVLAFLVLLAGIALRSRASEPERQLEGDFDARKTELLARARELKALREAGETGPEYHHEQMLELTDELAALLFEQSEQKLKTPRAGKRAG